MKVKKVFVLSILVVMVTIFFTGCSYDITSNFKESQRVAEEFLTIKGYELPKGYEVRYVNESEKQLYVKTGITEILFDIFDGKPEVRTINVSGITENATISSSCIEQIEEVANDFLNTAGYNIPQGYSIKYLGDKKQLQVGLSKEKDDNNPPMKITVTFDIVDDELEITDIYWNVSECVNFISVIFYIFILVAVIVIIVIAISYS